MAKKWRWPSPPVRLDRGNLYLYYYPTWCYPWKPPKIYSWSRIQWHLVIFSWVPEGFCCNLGCWLVHIKSYMMGYLQDHIYPKPPHTSIAFWNNLFHTHSSLTYTWFQSCRPLEKLWNLGFFRCLSQEDESSYLKECNKFKHLVIYCF